MIMSICGECNYYQEKDRVTNNNGFIHSNGLCLHELEERNYHDDACEIPEEEEDEGE